VWPAETVAVGVAVNEVTVVVVVSFGAMTTPVTTGATSTMTLNFVVLVAPNGSVAVTVIVDVPAVP